ncbi:MAG TPA: HD-GYP domain-containing protein [Gaiellaceae bacterium]|nr:HD-GYP domain-containing protein [Gaiellaceae bacterium]
MGSLLATLSDALEARDPYLRGHSARVTLIAEGLARRLGWRGEKLEALRLGGSLHDVGKIAVDSKVLRKPGPLTEQELAEIRTHPRAGARLIEAVEDFRPALPYVLHHHERWDGGGYPDGLRGEEIPVEGRLLGVADAFDAMTSDRSYRPALTVDQALAELERCAGTQFDPELTETFVEGWRSGEITPAEPSARVA